MSTTQTVVGVAQKNFPHQGGDLYVYEMAVLIDGAYAQGGGRPTFNVLAALQAQQQGVSAVVVTAVTTVQDYNDGTNRYTAPNAQTALSGTGNQTVTFGLYSGTTDGITGGAEVTAAAAVHGVVTFLVVAQVTPFI